MFKLLRNKRLMKVVVGFVAITFLGGFVGSFALRSLGNETENLPSENEFSEQLSIMLDQMSKDQTYYESLIEENPENPDNYILLADSYYDLAGIRSRYYAEDVNDLLLQAAEHYQTAFDLDETRVNLRLSIAMVKTALGDYEEADLQYLAFLDIYPDSFEANALYTQMLFMSNEQQAAQSRLEVTRSLADEQEEVEIVEQLDEILNAS